MIQRLLANNPGGEAVSRQVAWAAGIWLGLAIIFSGPTVRAADAQPAEAALDPLQWAVVNSLRHPERTTPEDLLEAAVRSAAVEALGPTLEFLGQFDRALAGAADPETTLAELGDSFPVAELNRLRRFLKAAAPPEDALAIGELIELMRAAADSRRTDPARLAQAANNLKSDSRGTRQRAAETLRRGGTAALPVLIDLLNQPVPPAGAVDQAASFVRTRRLTRQIVGQLGEAGVEALIVWLGSGDQLLRPGVITALDVLADRSSLPADGPATLDLASVLLEPAVSAELPEPVRQAAGSVLAKLAQAGLAPAELAGQPVRPARACRLLTAKLDQLLSPAGQPPADSLAEADTDLPIPTVKQFLWNAEAGRPGVSFLPPEQTRCLRARQLAGSLGAIGCTDPAAVRLVLLAQAESLLRFGEDPNSIEPVADPEAAVVALPIETVSKVLSGPEGFNAETVAAVLDEALLRELSLTAALTTRALREAAATLPLPVAAIRPALVRALTAPSDLVQFEAAQALAELAGPSSFAGASLMLERLIHFASSTGVDRAVIAHPSREVGTMLAAALSRFGYDTDQVNRGRDCLLAVRHSPDTVLVLVSSRLDLAAREMIQLLRQPALGDQRPVLVLLDPLDDDHSRRCRTRLVQTLTGFEQVLLTDRLESLFLPSLDPGNKTKVLPPRFPHTLARLMGPEAAADNRRRLRAVQRLERAAIAIDLLGGLGEQGWNVEPAFTAARSGLRPAETFPAAVRLLAIMPVPEAQRSLLDLAIQPDLPPPAREAAVVALEQSLSRHGMLLATSHRRDVISMYNDANGTAANPIGRALTALLTPASRPTAHTDASEPR